MRTYSLVLLFLLGPPVAKPQTSTFRIGAEEGYVEGGSIEAKGVQAKEGRDYHWLKGQRINVTQGGFSGRLLHGRTTHYHANGQLREEGRYHRGLRHGTWREWWPSGRVRSTQEWSNGRLSGWTRIHDEQGALLRSERYRHGVLKEVEVNGAESRKAKRPFLRIGHRAHAGDSAQASEPERSKAGTEEQKETSERKRSFFRFGKRGADTDTTHVPERKDSKARSEEEKGPAQRKKAGASDPEVPSPPAKKLQERPKAKVPRDPEKKRLFRRKQ